MIRASRFTSIGVSARVLGSALLIVILFVAGCTTTTSPAVNVTGATNQVDQGKTVALSAAVSNDVNAGGVTWAIASGPGTLTGQTATGVTYNAPSTVTSTTTVIVTATSVADKSKTANFTITLQPTPQITTTSMPNGSVGSAYSATVSMTGGVSPFTWALIAGPAGLSLSNSTTSTVTVQGTPTTAGVSQTLTVKVTDAQGMSATSSGLTVTVLPAPAVTSFLSGSATITAGKSTTLTPVFVNGTGSINNGVGAVTSGTPVNVTPSVTTTYTLTVSNSAGASVTAQTTVTVVVAPVITSFTSAAATITTGTSTTLTGVFTGGTGSVSNGVGAVTSGTAASTGTLSATTTFTLTVTNSAGTSVTAQTTVTVVPAPVITSFTPGAASITAGTSTTLTGVFTGGTGSVNNGVGTVTSATSVNVTPSVTTTYTLTVTNAAGTAVTSQTTVTVVPAPVITSFTPGAATITAGGSTTLTAVFSNGTGSVDNAVGAVVSGTAVNVSPAVTTTYTLTVTNSLGTSVTSQATVTGVAAPVITSFTPGSATIVSGSSTTLTAVFTGGTGSVDHGVGAVTSATPVNVSPTVTTTYTLTVTNAATTPASVTSTTTVTVHVPPAITSANNKTFTIGSNGTFTVTTTGNPAPALSESGSLPPGVTFTDNGNGTATISGTPSAPVANYPIVITASNGVGTNATQNFTLSVVLVQAPAITSANTVTYTVGTNGTFNVTTTGSPTPALTKTGTLPNNVTFTDNANGTATISGTPAAGTTGNYSITITAANGTAPNAQQSFTLGVVAAPAITSFTSGASTITSGSSTTLTAVFTGGTGTVNPGALAISSGVPVNISPSANTTYTLTVTNTATTPATVTSQTTVTIVPAPVLTSFTLGSSTIISGNSTTLTAVFSNGTGSVDHGVGPVTSGTPVNISPTATTTYTLTVTNTASTPATATATATVTVNSAPAITSSNNASFTVNVAGTFSVTTTGNPKPTLSFTGTLPSSVTFTDNGDGTATISGTPTGSAANYPIVITAANGIGSNATQNFTLAVVVPSCTSSCTISGTVSGPWVPGITISRSGTSTSTTTDSSGHYSFTGLAGGTYTITPTLAGYTFSPATPSVATSFNTTTQDFVEAPVVTSFSISGKVSYTGTHTTGTTFIRVYQNGCTGCSPVVETGFSGVPSTTGTPYIIRGLQPTGNPGEPSGYIVTAEIDTLGTGEQNLSNPVGSSTTVTIPSSNAVNINFSVSDPGTPPAPQAPCSTVQDTLSIAPQSTFAVAQCKIPQNLNGIEIATSYKIYAATNTGFTNNLVVQTFPAHGTHDNVFIMSNLTNGLGYFFKMTALVGTTESGPSNIFGPVTIGPSSSGSTVSGTVTFPPATIPAGTPLYAGVFSNSGIYAVRILNPVSGLTYSIPGVPNGTYQNFAIIDMNNNGIIDVGDISNAGNNSNPPTIVVSGNTPGNLALTNPVTTLDVTTNHQFDGLTHSYNVNFGVAWGSKRPIAITLFSGPNVAVPYDIVVDENNNGGQSPAFLQTATPVVGDTYHFQVMYSDGTSNPDMTASVTAVLTSFAQSPAMSTTLPNSRTVPLLTWAAPASPPTSYTYSVGLNNSNGSQENWYYSGGKNSNGIPSSQTSVVFNTDSSASPSPSLTTGTTYNWWVSVQDANGNSAQIITIYVP